jgi:hypothetical protein
MHCAKNLRAAEVIRYMEAVTALSGSLGDEFKPAQWFPRSMVPPSLRTVPDDEHIRISLAGLVLGQVAGEAFLADLLAELAALPEERCTKLVQAFGAWPTLLSLVVDRIWLEEDKKNNPDWERLVAWFADMSAKAAALAAEPFVALCTRAASVICNEYLNDQERAAQLLGTATATAPGYVALLFDQRAKIAAQKNDWPGALEAVRQALASWDESEFELHPKMLALQRAGTWAGKLEQWPQSAGYFAHAAKLAKRIPLVVNEAGLETDAAVARWRAQDRAAALDGFVRALELCEKMPPFAEDLATLQFQKLLGHILLTFAMGYRRSPLQAPQAPVVPGMASEPALNEKVKTLPPPRLAACKVFVAMLEHNYQLGDARWERYRTEVLNGRSVSTRGFALELAIRKCIQRGAAAELPALATRQASVMAVASALAAKGSPAEVALLTEDAVFPPAPLPFEDHMGGEGLFLAALIGAIAQGGDFAATLREFVAHADESPFPEALRKMSERGLAIAALSEADLFSVSWRASDETERVMACLALLSQAQLTPEGLWGALYVPLTTLRGNYWGADVLRQLDRFAGQRWRRAAENRSAFRNPTLWLPDLKARCDEPVTGSRRLATLLLTVVPALTLPLDGEIVRQLRGMRDGTLTHPVEKLAPRLAE